MNYGINPQQLKLHVIRPTLQHLSLWSPAAEQLVLGTALTESRGEFIKQLGSGPALGLWQMEPATHDDIWQNYLRYNPELAGAVSELTTAAAITKGALEMAGNLYYGGAMCRVHYRRVRHALPTAGDALQLARYWKDFYNTLQGAGTVAKALPHFEAACNLE